MFIFVFLSFSVLDSKNEIYANSSHNPLSHSPRFSPFIHRALKEAALAQRVKEKAKKKGGFFGFGGKAVTKEEEEVDAEQDHDDKEEVRKVVFVGVFVGVCCVLWLVVCVRVFVCLVRCCVCVVYSYFCLRKDDRFHG